MACSALQIARSRRRAPGGWQAFPRRISARRREANRTIRERSAYPGLGASSDEFGPTIADTARQTAILTALDPTQAGLRGLSIGGFLAQEIALIHPALAFQRVGPTGSRLTVAWLCGASGSNAGPEEAWIAASC